MTAPRRRPNEVSAGGVLARPAADGWEVCLVRAKAHWGLPKGHVEAGESPPEAALREIAEECGLPRRTLAILGELAPSEYVYRRGAALMFKLVHQFVVTTEPGITVTPQDGEIDEARWMSLDEAAARATFPDTRAALQGARALLGVQPTAF